MRDELSLRWNDAGSVLKHFATKARTIPLTAQEQAYIRWAEAVLDRVANGWKWHFVRLNNELHFARPAPSDNVPVCLGNARKNAGVVEELVSWKVSCRQCGAYWQRQKRLHRIVYGSIVSIDDLRKYWRQIGNREFASIRVPSFEGGYYVEYQRLEFVRDPRLIETIYKSDSLFFKPVEPGRIYEID